MAILDGGVKPVDNDADELEVDLDKVADELRQLMALRSRSSVRDRACPELDRLLSSSERGSRDARYLAVAKLIDNAVDDIFDPAHRSAARSLLGSGDGRWRTVSQRGAEAAAEFGCGWDAYRRRRTNGTSQLDDTLQALAEAMARRDRLPATPAESAAAAAAAPSTAADQPRAGHQRVQPEVRSVTIGPDLSGEATHDLVAPDPATQRRPSPSPDAGGMGARRVAVVVTAAVVIAAVAWAGLAYLSDEPADEETADRPVCALLDEEVGALPDGADAQMRTWSARFRAFARTLPPDLVECAGVMQKQHGLVMQPVASSAPLGIGALVAADQPGSKIIHLDYLEFWSYQTYLDQFGVDMIGTPVERQDRADRRLVMLTRGAIVGESPHVSFLVVGGAWEEWMSSGGLDGPMGGPISKMRDQSGKRYQDFDNGRLVIDLVDPSSVEWEPVVNAESALPQNVQNSLLRAEDGTAWFVDEDLVRHWVPTTNDYNCTAKLGTTEYVRVPAQAIVTLKAGDPINCR